mgnify:CR=1 FL=1
MIKSGFGIAEQRHDTGGETIESGKETVSAAADGLHDCFRRRCGHRVVHRADKKARRLLSSTDFAGRTCYNGATAYPMRVYFPTPARRAGPKMQTIPSDFISEGTFFVWAAPHNSSSAFAGYFLPIHRYEKLEILRSRWRLCRLTDAACPLRVHKVFLQFPNLNLEQNPSLTALAI